MIELQQFMATAVRRVEDFFRHGKYFKLLSAVAWNTNFTAFFAPASVEW